MNSCILMAQVIRPPELRYTQENQTPIAQMLVEFEGRRPEDPALTLKVIGWGNLATQMQESYKEGDRLIIDGRLSMNTFDRPEGFKEKRAELVASHIYPLDSYPTTPTTSAVGNNVISMDAYQPPSSSEPTPPSSTATIAPPTQPESHEGDPLDEIPF